MHVFGKIISFTMLALASSLSFGMHIAMAVPSHATHEPVSLGHASGCSMLCMATPSSVQGVRDNKEDDEGPPPILYQKAVVGALALEHQHTQEARLVTSREPPPGIGPAYITLTVFRV